MLAKSNLGLYTDFYELTMAQGYFLTGNAEKPACFDYFFRKLPFDGGYVIFAGLDDVLQLIEDFHYSDESIRYLADQGLDKKFLEFLKQFRFKGRVCSVPEGEVVFPNEILMRFEGGVLETQLLETLVLNLINFESLVATKASRLRLAAGQRTILDFGLRRAQGWGGIHASRAAVIGGADNTSNVYSAQAFDLKISGTMAHSWIESFQDELEAFRTFARIFPNNTVLLVDTYNSLQSGIPNAITVAHEMKEAGQHLIGIRLDSGDLAYLSKRARTMLDNAGLKDVKIVASNQLDEHIIKSLLEQGAPIDVFGVGTNLVTGKDDAALDGVYKLSMYDETPKLKISDNIEKVLLPGMKKVFRFSGDHGEFFADAIVREQDPVPERMIHPLYPLKQLPLSGYKEEKLLSVVMQNGSRTVPGSSPSAIGNFVRQRLERLPTEHKRFENPHVYKVGIGKELMDLRDRLLEKHAPF